MMKYLHRSLVVALPLLALALLALPALVAARLGWLTPAPPSGLERWTLAVLFYLPWTAAVMVAFVWGMDRLGLRWHAHDRPPRTKRQRRRLLAAMRLEQALDEAEPERPRRQPEGRR